MSTSGFNTMFIARTVAADQGMNMWPPFMGPWLPFELDSSMINQCFSNVSRSQWNLGKNTLVRVIRTETFQDVYFDISFIIFEQFVWRIFWHFIWHILASYLMFWHSIRQSIWHIFWNGIGNSIWHSIWHSFWQYFIWHSIWHSTWDIF